MMDANMTFRIDADVKAQMAAIDGIKAGMRCADADKIARDVIREAGYGDCSTFNPVGLKRKYGER